MSSIPFVPGQRFGRLVTLSVTHIEEYGRSRLLWLCVCDCGNEKAASPSALHRRQIISCGCASQPTHGRSRTPLYKLWTAMKGRCYRESGRLYAHYGGRGIVVCDRWLHSFENFLADMGERPSPAHTIERADNDGPYAPWNCHWATRLEQNNNTSRNRFLTFQGRTQSLTAWAREIGIADKTLSGRIHTGWSVERALTEPASWYKNKPKPTACKAGHPYPENLTISPRGQWRCGECHRQIINASRARKRLEGK